MGLASNKSLIKSNGNYFFIVIINTHRRLCIETRPLQKIVIDQNNAKFDVPTLHSQEGSQ
jgi:hypothetical protein